MDANATGNPMARMPYLTDAIPGIGGSIKNFVEDFVVEEVPLYEPADEGTHVFFGLQQSRLAPPNAIPATPDPRHPTPGPPTP